MKVYFEAGANDGVFQSRTLKYKDDSEWMGILVEPDPRCQVDLWKNRANPFTYIYDRALVSRDYDVRLGEHTLPGSDEVVPAGQRAVVFYQHHHSAMNYVVNPRGETGSPITVYATDITEICNEIGITTIDELYLDVEGYECDVLLGIDPSITVKWAEIELHRHDTEEAGIEFDSILAAMSRIGMEWQSTNNSEGHPKLIFQHKSIQ